MPKVVDAQSPNNVDPKPRIAWLLRSLPGDKLYHQRLRLRHPAGIYSLSLGRLSSRFQNVLNELDSVRADYADSRELPELEILIDRQESLLYALAEHLDDCKNILKSFFESNKTANKDEAVRDSGSRVADYRNRVGQIVNSVKHRTGRLCGVMMYDEEIFVPGYYVESAIDRCTVGPDPMLHNGGDTAISLYRDLKYHFVQVYFLGNHLENAVLGIWNSRLEAKYPEPGKEPMDFLELGRRLRLLPDVVYFDERLVAYPRITIRRANDPRSELRFSCEPPVHPLRTFRQFQLRASFQGDGFTTTFKLPYFRTGWQRDFRSV